jgi:hypothetical protein
VSAYDDLLNGELKDFVARSTELGGDVAEMAAIVTRGFQAQREFLVMASHSKVRCCCKTPRVAVDHCPGVCRCRRRTSSCRCSHT